MIDASIIIASLFPLFILAALWRAEWRSGSPLGAAVVGTTLVHELVLISFPLWHAVIGGYPIEKEIGVAPLEMLRVTGGECAFLITFSLGMRMWASHTQSTQRRPLPVLANGAAQLDEWLLYALIVCGAAVQARSLLQPVAGLGELSLHAELDLGFSGGTIWNWFRATFAFPGLVASAIVLARPKTPAAARWLGAAVLIAVAVIGVVGGVRGRVTWVVSLLVICGVMYQRRRVVIGALAVLVAFAPLSTFIGGSFRSIIYTELTGASWVEVLGRIWDEALALGTTASDSDVGFVYSLATRAQGPRNAAFLYRLYDLGSGARTRPIEGALYLPIPRAMWPEKRPAGSVDNTNYGAAIYIVRRIGYASPIYVMGPVLASAHAYWEGGWVWLLIAGFLTGLFWRGVLWWSARQGMEWGIVFALSYMSALVIDGLLTTQYPVYSLISVTWTVILPIAITRAFLHAASESLRRRGDTAATRGVDLLS